MVFHVGDLEYVMADLCISIIDIVLPKVDFEDAAGLGADKDFLI